MSASKPGRLQGRAALVTGGGAGIGAATARLFCAEGASVALVDLDAAALVRTAEAIRAELPGARMVCHAADIADAAQAPLAVQAALDAFGGLDILVNNVAMRNYAHIADAAPEAWQAMVGVNLMGPANYCRAALPALRASGKGAIVTVSSCYAVTGRAGQGLYDATKAGLLAMTRSLAFEETAKGVRANAVCPGSTFTDFHVNKAKASGKSPEQLSTARQTTIADGPLGPARGDRLADPLAGLG
ncbi:MAG: SDR family oxidoreductase [Candidatus Protistobacter heckmanni]|nr:SDR family oxidoreductase [Candidatus Protistobacter heckmanni]